MVLNAKVSGDQDARLRRVVPEALRGRKRLTARVEYALECFLAWAESGTLFPPENRPLTTDDSPAEDAA